VGPRPEMPSLVEKYEFGSASVLQCLKVAPAGGRLMGAAISQCICTLKKICITSNYSLLLDIQITSKTIGAVLKRKGAY